MLETSTFAGETNIGSKVSELYSAFNIEIIEFESKNDDNKSNDDNNAFGLSFINKNNKQKYYKLFNLNDCNNIKRNTELGMIKTDKFINIILYSLSKANNKNSVSFKEINNDLSISIKYETDFFTVNIGLNIPAKLSDIEIVKSELKALKNKTKDELAILKDKLQKTENELKETKKELNALKQEFKLFMNRFTESKTVNVNDEKMESNYVTTWSAKFKGDLTLSNNNTRAYSNQNTQFIRAKDAIPKGSISIWKFIAWIPMSGNYFFGVYKCDGNKNSSKVYPNPGNQYGIEDSSNCMYYGKSQYVYWNKPQIKAKHGGSTITIRADYTDNKQLKLTFYYMNKIIGPPNADYTMILPEISDQFKWYPACLLQNSGSWCKISFS